MQFKREFFTSEFYNCGGAVEGNYNEYINFLKNLDYKPKTVIVGLDAWVFNDAWNHDLYNYEQFIAISETNRGNIALLKSMIHDAADKKWTLNDLRNYPDNIGFNGRVKDTGFMYDGSYYYGNIYRDPTTSSDYEFKNTIDRITTGGPRFEWGEYIDSDTIIQLENLLNYCKNEDINVIGFLPPFAPSIYRLMDTSENYMYLNEISPTCQRVFYKYGYEFYDYMDGECLGVTDAYFIDGFHGSDIVYARILENMIENESILTQYTDLHILRQLTQNAFSELVYMDPDLRNISSSMN